MASIFHGQQKHMNEHLNWDLYFSQLKKLNCGKKSKSVNFISDKKNSTLKIGIGFLAKTRHFNPKQFLSHLKTNIKNYFLKEYNDKKG